MIEHLSHSGGCFESSVGEMFCYDSPDNRMRQMIRADAANKRKLAAEKRKQGG